MAKKSVYEIITAEIMEIMEQGIIPWRNHGQPKVPTVILFPVNSIGV